MKVLYDYQAFTVRYGGVSRYYRQLLEHLPPDVSATLPMLFSNNYYLADRRYSQHRAFFADRDFRGRDRLMALINRRYTLARLRTARFDVLHATENDGYFLPALGNRPFVLTIHDMMQHLFRDTYFQYIPAAHQAAEIALLRRTPHLIAVSEHTKRDLIHLAGVNPERVTVIPHGYAPAVGVAAGAELADVPDRFVLYVGKRDRYKNFARLVEALAPVLQRDAGLWLYCAGGGAFTPEETDRLTAHGLTGRVRQAAVSDAKLAALYQRARLFVYPSEYEGFGLPILEAFGNGCPVLLSEASCFPEVAQDAAAYFVTDNDDSLRQQLERLLADAPYRRQLIARGHDRLRAFSWRTAAQQTHRVYQQVLDGGPTPTPLSTHAELTGHWAGH